jgi:hypothetical protein
MGFRVKRKRSLLVDAVLCLRHGLLSEDNGNIARSRDRGRGLLETNVDELMTGSVLERGLGRVSLRQPD